MYKTEKEINDAAALVDLMDSLMSDELKRKYMGAFRTLGLLFKK
jgi:hypothetical protein